MIITTAAANGMTRIKEYRDGEESLLVCAITRADWENDKKGEIPT